MALTLSLNTNPLVNRFADPDDLIETVARDLRIRDLQLTHEFINPSWPAPVIRRLTRQMAAAPARTGVRVTSGMTGPYGRLNHFGHPDRDVRRYYVDWFKTFADITADLGGFSVGTQFAIFTYKDFDDPARREELIRIAIDCWAEVAEHAKAAGLRYVFWEPMSVGREFGETIAKCLALQDRLTAANMAVPMWMMADIDHGDVTSSNPDDYDPYAWARAVPKVSPIIHIKQKPDGQGRSSAVHRRVQRQGAASSRNRCSRPSPRAERSTTRSASNFLQGARAQRPPGHSADRRKRGFLGAAYRHRRAADLSGRVVGPRGRKCFKGGAWIGTGTDNSRRMDDRPRASLAVRAVWLHYAGGLTQAAVAERLGIPSVKAHRLIARAVADGVVKVSIDGEIVECNRPRRSARARYRARLLRGRARISARKGCRCARSASSVPDTCGARSNAASIE